MLADEATGTGGGGAAPPAASAPAATPAAPASTSAPAGTATQGTDPNAAAPQDGTQPVEGQQPEAQIPDEFGDLFTGEEPAPEADPTAVGADLQQYLSMNPNVNSPELLAGAVADAGLMWDVIKGTQQPSALFETLRANNPQAWQNVMNGVGAYIEQTTGMKLVDPAQLGQGAQQLTPEQQRIQQLEQSMQREQQQREQFALTQRVNAAQRQMVDFTAQALKGSFLEGDEAFTLQMVGQKLAGKEQDVIDALQRGDTSMLDKAIKQVRHEERIRFNRYGKRLVEQRNALKNALPKADGSGAPPDARTGKPDFDLTTREGRLKYQEAVFRGEVQV